MRLHTPDSHDRRHTQRDIFDAVLSVHHRRHRQNRALIADDTLADTFYRHRNSVIRRLFFRNNLVSTVFDLLRDRVHRRIVVKMPAHLAELVQRNARYIRTAPRRDLAVPVLADNKRMHTPAVHAQVFAQRVFEPRRVKHRPRTKHPFLRQPTQFQCHIRQNIHRIRYDQQNPAKIAFYNLRDDTLINCRILLHQVKPRLPRLLVRPRCDNDDRRVRRVVIRARVDLHLPCKRNPVRDILRLAVRLFHIHI